MATYDNNSPYANTEVVNGQYLDILSIRPVPAYDDDILYTIESQYQYRPDLAGCGVLAAGRGTDQVLFLGKPARLER